MSTVTSFACHSILDEAATDSIPAGVFGCFSVPFLSVLLFYNNESGWLGR
jgi:hypothetical protein